MPREKKQMGRPPKNPLPPRIDASPEEIAHVVLNAGRPKGPVQDRRYHCGACERQVAFPETLYNDGLCESCHRAAT